MCPALFGSNRASISTAEHFSCNSTEHSLFWITPVIEVGPKMRKASWRVLATLCTLATQFYLEALTHFFHSFRIALSTNTLWDRTRAHVDSEKTESDAMRCTRLTQRGTRVFLLAELPWLWNLHHVHACFRYKLIQPAILAMLHRARALGLAERAKASRMHCGCTGRLQSTYIRKAMIYVF